METDVHRRVCRDYMKQGKLMEIQKKLLCYIIPICNTLGKTPFIGNPLKAHWWSGSLRGFEQPRVLH